VKDLARTIVTCLDHPKADGETYFACGMEVATAAQLGQMIADELRSTVIRLPLPVGFLYPMCVGQELISRLTGKANVLSRQKYAELSAPGWVCDGSKLRQQLGQECDTPLRAGIRQTAEWYRQAGWI
jgi:nucleoside-diphosphate-sugar epimerase